MSVSPGGGQPGCIAARMPWDLRDTALDGSRWRGVLAFRGASDRGAGRGLKAGALPAICQRTETDIRKM